MATKKITFHLAAREKLLRGTAQLADAVRVTLGRWITAEDRSPGACAS